MQKTTLWSFLFLLLILSCQKNEKANAEKAINQKAIADSLALVKKNNAIRPILDSIILKNKFNGVVSVEWDAKKVYDRPEGFSDFKNQRKLNTATVFPIASNSKQFTAVLLLQLQEQQKLNIDDKVSQYISSFLEIPSYKNITIAQLLHHSSGINTMGEKLLFSPGTNFHYSNDTYKILGDIIEKITGKTYDANVMELFQKLRMTHSSTGNLYQGHNFSSAYIGSNTNAKEVANMPKRLDKSGISIAAGGILSTVDDLHLWNNALYNGKILHEDSFQTFVKPSQTFEHYILNKVGYGCGIMIFPENPLTYLHTGYVKGAPSLNIYYPKSKISVVILSNIANEALGKKAIYKVHRQIRVKMDSIAQTW